MGFMKRHTIIPILCGLALCSCATFSEFIASPDSKQALSSLASGAAAYASGNQLGAAVNGIQGAAALLRAIQGTPKAAVPSAVIAATATGGAAPIAKLAADAIAVQVANGAKPDAANEAVAKVLDYVAAKAR